MVAKKPAPAGIPISKLVQLDRALPAHQRKLHRAARESAMSTDGSISVADAIEDEYVRLADADEKYRDTQRKKATKRRGVIGNETMADIIERLARREGDPRELWPHLYSAIEHWAGECQQLDDHTLKYPCGEDEDGEPIYKTIRYKHFRARVNEARPPKAR